MAEQLIKQLDMTPEGLGPWSISKLKMLRKCPLQFYLQYIEKRKVPENTDTLIQDMGSAIHAILENAINGRSIGDSFKIARRKYESKIPEDKWTENVVSVTDQIELFMSKIEDFNKKHPIKECVSELRLGVTRDWKPTGFFDKDVYFRGIVDLAILLENNDALILDHKSFDPGLSGLKWHGDQLNAYKIMIHFGLQKIAGAQSGIHYVKEGNILLDEYVPASVIEGRLRQTLQFNIEEAIRTVEDLGYFKHFSGSQCNWCGHREACKGGELKEFEKATSKVIPIKAI